MALQAKQYNVAAGWTHAAADGARVRLGAAATRASVSRLNNLVVGQLVDAGIPALGVHPFSSGWVTCGKQVRPMVSFWYLHASRCDSAHRPA
jgi:isopentenyl phosphate kinase